MSVAIGKYASPGFSGRMRRGPWSVTVLLLLMGPLAGCLGADGPGTASDGDAGDDEWMPGSATVRPEFDFSQALDRSPGHDHGNPSQHAASFELDQVGYSAVVEASDPEAVPGGHAELALAGAWAFVANWGPHRGFSILDVSDPAKPRHVSDFRPDQAGAGPAKAGGGSYWDVSVTADSNLTVLSAQALAMLPAPGSEEEHGGGVYLVNTEDKTRPYMESFTQVIDQDALIPVGVHNARPFETLDGRLFVAATTANGQTYLLEVVGQPGSRTLEQVSIVTGVHDTAVQVHPVTGDLLLYGAQGGVYITNVTDPANPEILGVVPNGQDGLQAYHQVVPNDVLIEGRHYTVATTESAEGVPTPFTILDTTDPLAPTVVGQWILPIDVAAPEGQPYRWSGHNLDVNAGRMYIGHYHAGVWIVDFSSAVNAAQPFPIAFHQPHEEGVYVPHTLLGRDIPAVWNVILHEDGHIYASDMNTGVYVLWYAGAPSPYEGAPRWPTNVR